MHLMQMFGGLLNSKKPIVVVVPKPIVKKTPAVATSAPPAANPIPTPMAAFLILPP